jgi:hypothetical protein
MTRDNREQAPPKTKMSSMAASNRTESKPPVVGPVPQTPSSAKQETKSKVMITGDDILIEYVQRLVKALAGK